MLNDKTFCILPFVGASVRTNGDITLCCHSQETVEHNIKTSTINQWWQSDFVHDVRQRMLAGETLDICQKCYTDEANNFSSLRTERNSEYKIVQIKHADKLIKHLGYDQLDEPVDVEIQLTNLCNLKCIMCNETESSAILTENRQLNIAIHNQLEYEWTEQAIEHVKRLFVTDSNKLINLRGGEPLVVPQIREILASAGASAQHISLHITTNATRFDAEWFDVLNQFKEVRIMVSVDAVGALGEYIRYGSKWDTVQKNIQAMRQLKNVNLVANVTVQNLNLLGLADLTKWSQECKIHLLFKFLTDPEFLAIDVLPAELIDLAKFRLEVVKQTANLKLVPDLEGLISRLSDMPSAYYSQRWHDFVANLHMREKIRQNSVLTVIPELKNYINA